MKLWLEDNGLGLLNKIDIVDLCWCKNSWVQEWRSQLLVVAHIGITPSPVQIPTHPPTQMDYDKAHQGTHNLFMHENYESLKICRWTRYILIKLIMHGFSKRNK